MEILLKVKNVKTKQGASLLECIRKDGTLERRVVPSDLVVHEGENSFIKTEDFEMGMSYGLPLEDLIQDVTVKAKDLIDNLHSTGLWTYEDLMANPNGIISSIMATAGTNLSSILQAIKAHVKGEHNGN